MQIPCNDCELCSKIIQKAPRLLSSKSSNAIIVHAIKKLLHVYEVEYK